MNSCSSTQNPQRWTSRHGASVSVQDRQLYLPGSFARTSAPTSFSRLASTRDSSLSLSDPITTEPVYSRKLSHDSKCGRSDSGGISISRNSWQRSQLLMSLLLLIDKHQGQGRSHWLLSSESGAQASMSVALERWPPLLQLERRARSLERQLVVLTPLRSQRGLLGRFQPVMTLSAVTRWQEDSTVDELAVGVVVSTQFSGGAERYLTQLYGGLSARGRVSAELLGRMPGWEATNLPEVVTGFGDKWTKADLGAVVSDTVVARKSAIRAILDRNILYPKDLFHLQFKREQFLLSERLSHVAPVVWTEHGPLYDGRGRHAFEVAYRRASRRVKCIVCVGELSAATVRRVVPNARVEVIPNAYDDRRFRVRSPIEREEIRASLSVPSGRTMVVVANRLQLEKGVDRAIIALSGTDASLLIAGDGPDRSRLEKVAAAHRLDVRFLGHVESPEFLLGAADIAIVCAYPNEGHNLASMEAAGSGCLLIGFSGDPTENFIRDCGGVVLAPGESLSPHLRRLDHLLEASTSQEAVRPYVLGPWLAKYESLLETLIE